MLYAVIGALVILILLFYTLYAALFPKNTKQKREKEEEKRKQKRADRELFIKARLEAAKKRDEEKIKNEIGGA